MTAIAAPAPRPAGTAASLDLSPGLRGVMIAGGITVGSLAIVAVGRVLAGFAPPTDVAKQVAVVIHLMAVLPAIPLGLYVLVARKGGARHRLLGKLWMAMMLVTALSALFIRNLNGGHFSWIHLFVPFTLIGMYRAIVAARAGQIAKHRRALIGLFIGALLIPGLFSFVPGRVMWAWLVG